MDANKDEAYKCIALAKVHLNTGNKAEALRFVKKAKRIYPLIDVSYFEKVLNETAKESSAPNNSSSATTNNSSASTTRRRRNSSSHSRANEAKNYTKEQLQAVKKIIDCKDLYDVLGVSKSCSDAELKKAYRTMALKFHPDKNQAPRASEAFKKIGKAFDTLSDKEKRRRYDDTGATDDTVSASYHRASSAHYQDFQGFDSDVFNIFFNSGFPFSQFTSGGPGGAGGHTHRAHQHTRTHRTYTENRDSERSNNYFVYIQLLPLLILFVLSFFSSVMVKDPVYSFQRSNKFSVERFTSPHNIPYFVKTSFKSDYGTNIPYIESQIEEEFQTNLRYRCYREKEYKENFLYRARYYGSDEDYNKALRISVPSCDKLLEVFGS